VGSQDGVGADLPGLVELDRSLREDQEDGDAGEFRVGEVPVVEEPDLDRRTDRLLQDLPQRDGKRGGRDGCSNAREDGRQGVGDCARRLDPISARHLADQVSRCDQGPARSDLVDGRPGLLEGGLESPVDQRHRTLDGRLDVELRLREVEAAGHEGLLSVATHGGCQQELR
jgi:hypothetical protein